MTSYIISCDLGSSTIKAALVDSRGVIACLRRASAPPVELPSGAFDPDACVRILGAAIREMIDAKACRPSDIAAICLTSQRSTLVAVGPDGAPLMPALSWQGTACADAASDFFLRFGEARYHRLTGMPPSMIYAAAKLAHLKRDRPEIFRKARAFIFLPDYVMKRMGADAYVTDPSGGSAGGLFNIRERRWSLEILDALGLETKRLPLILPAGSLVGYLNEPFAGASGLSAGIPLILGGADQQCATLGAGAMTPGDCVLSLGTSAAVEFPLFAPVFSESRDVLHMCHVHDDQWVAEGFMSSFGNVLQWAAGTMGVRDVGELEPLARNAPAACGGPLFLPSLAGGLPPDSENAFVHLAPGTGRNVMAHAIVDGLAMEIRRILEIVRAQAPMNRMVAVGGASSTFLCKTIAHAAGVELSFCEQKEGALIGAAMAGWFGAGRFDTLTEAARCMAPVFTGTITPDPERMPWETRYQSYCRAMETISGNEDHD